MSGEGGGCLSITIDLTPDEGGLSPPLEDLIWILAIQEQSAVTKASGGNPINSPSVFGMGVFGTKGWSGKIEQTYWKLEAVLLFDRITEGQFLMPKMSGTTSTTERGRRGTLPFRRLPVP